MHRNVTRSWYFRLYLWLFRERVVQAVAEPAFHRWDLVERIFATANAVYPGPIGYAATLPLEAELFRIVLDKEGAEEFFTRSLLDTRPMLVGYALEGLEWLNSDQLNHLPPQVLNSSALVSTQLGCTGMELTLGELAGGIVRRKLKLPA